MRLDRLLTLYAASPITRGFGKSSAVKLPVLMYHGVNAQADDHLHPYFQTVTTPARFVEHMAWLHEAGYQTLTLSEGVEVLQGSRNNDLRQVVITFDDGLADFADYAMPVLVNYGFTATVFVSTDMIGKTFLTGQKCLSEIQIKSLASQGIEFGSHTVSHPQLYEVSEEQLIAELKNSKSTLESILSTSCKWFSYPYRFPEANRQFTARLQEILAKQGYSGGVTTIIGTAKAGDNLFFLKRLPINDNDDLELFKAKLDGAYDWLHPLQLSYKKLKALKLKKRSKSSNLLNVNNGHAL